MDQVDDFRQYEERSMKPYLSGTLTGRMGGDHRPNMQNIANMQNITRTMEGKILSCLRRNGMRTFDQLTLAAGMLGPDGFNSPEKFHARVDEKLRELMACGKVRLVARRPTLCFEIGTVLDQIVKGLELDDQED